MKNLSLKTLALGILALFAVTTVSAQEEPAKKNNKFGLANRIGVGVGYGTEGLGFDVAIPLTQYVQVRAGLNIFPNIKFHENIDVEYVGETPLAGEQTIEDKVRLDAKFGRTYADLKFDVYPFGNRGNFFVTAGLSFGGSDLMSIKGHSEKVEEYGPAIKDYGINIGDYNIPFDEKGEIKGGVKVKKVRPYLGNKKRQKLNTLHVFISLSQKIAVPLHPKINMYNPVEEFGCLQPHKKMLKLQS